MIFFRVLEKKLNIKISDLDIKIFYEIFPSHNKNISNRFYSKVIIYFDFNQHKSSRRFKFFKKLNNFLEKENLTLEDYCEAILLCFNYSLKFSKTFKKIGDDFIFDRAEIFEAAHKYFSLISYKLIFENDDTSFNLSNDVLVDLIIIYEDIITENKLFSFKESVANDMLFLNNTILNLSNLESIVEDWCLSIRVESNKLIKKKKSTKSKNQHPNLIYLKKSFEVANSEMLGDFKQLSKLTRSLDPYYFKEIDVFRRIITQIIEIYKNFDADSKVIIEEMCSMAEDIKTSEFFSKHKHYTNLLKSIFFLKKGDVFKYILTVYKIYVGVYKYVCSVLFLFKNKTRMLEKPINLKNLNVRDYLKVVKFEYNSFLIKALKTHKGWYKTMIVSLRPYNVVEAYSYKIVTNGLPNNSFEVFTLKKNKVTLELDGCGSEVRSIIKQVSTPLYVDKKYLNMMKDMVLIWEHRPDINSMENSLFASILDSEEVAILKKLIYLIENYGIKEVFLPWYFDSRKRLYCYSVFSPTAGRLVRGILNIKPSPSSDESLQKRSLISRHNEEVFNDVDMSVFSRKLESILESITIYKYDFKRDAFLFYERSPILFWFLLANKYCQKKIIKCKDLGRQESFAILFEDLLNKIESRELPLLDYLEYENSLSFNKYRKKPSTNLSSEAGYLEESRSYSTPLKILFNKLFFKNKADKSDALEELNLMFLFSKFLKGDLNFHVQADVSSSALVLCGLPLGVYSPRRLNLSDNNFLKNDPYELLATTFIEEHSFLKDFKSLGSLVDRKLFKKPAMTIMYGSGKSTTVEKLSDYLRKAHQFTLDDCLDTNDEREASTKPPLASKIGVDASEKIAGYIYDFLVAPPTNYNRNFKKKIYLLNIFSKIERNSGYCIEDENESQPLNQLSEIFFVKDMGFFQGLARECLLIDGGIAYINGEVTSLGYTPSLSRIKVSSSLNEVVSWGDIKVSSPKVIKFSIQRHDLGRDLQRFFIDSYWSFIERSTLSKSGNEAVFRSYLLEVFNLFWGLFTLELEWSEKDEKILQKSSFTSVELDRRKLEPVITKKRIQELWSQIIMDSRSRDEGYCTFLKNLNDLDIERIFFVSYNLLPKLSKFEVAFRANLIHSVDAYQARSFILVKERPMITNHDCFFIKCSELSNEVDYFNSINRSLEIKVSRHNFKYNFGIKNNLPFF